MGCVALLLAFLAGMSLFLAIGIAINSWWGAAIVGAALLLVVTLQMLRVRARAVTFGSVGE